MSVNYALFPLQRSVKTIRSYIEDGTDPGPFKSIVENDLINTMTSIDEDWLPCLHSLVLWFYTEVPAHCIGSIEKVAFWMARGGENGIRAEAEINRQKNMAHLSTFDRRPYEKVLHRPIEPMD